MEPSTQPITHYVGIDISKTNLDCWLRPAAKQPHCPALIEKGWARQLGVLETQIQALQTRITEIVASHEGLSNYYKLLKNIPGIGDVTAWLWLITFYGETQLNPKQIASRFGVAPHSHTSGSSVRGRTRSSGHGAAEMRSNMTLWRLSLDPLRSF